MVEWQTKTLGMVLAGLSQSEKQHSALLEFIDGLALFPTGGLDVASVPPVPLTPEEEMEEVMSGRYAEQHARGAPAAAVQSLLGHGFMPG